VVFEHLFPERLLERKEWTAFFLAFIYATLSIIIARLLFPANSGIVSVVFVSIFLIPYFETILKREERQEKREKKGIFRLFKDNADAIRTYFFLFFGIYLAYMTYALLAPVLGFPVDAVFREQLSLESVRGGAVFSSSTFFSILMNNWWVLLACFLIALIAGDGAIFFIAWNASTWGTIFGYRALMASMHTGESVLWVLLLLVLITLPHVILEGGAYILAALAGGVISDEIIEKSEELREFVLYFIGAVLLYGLYYMIIYGRFSAMIETVLLIGGALVMPHLMQFIFSGVQKKVFRYNFYLFACAIGVFILGAAVETLVLYNVTPLQHIYFAALG
jgi:uncharacterized membrane protein SpoIIM required for sporulation